MANIQRIHGKIHGRRSKYQPVHGACNCWRTKHNEERRPVSKTKTTIKQNEYPTVFQILVQLTKTGPLGPALRTVAPNHWSDFWSICWPDALLFPVFIWFSLNSHFFKSIQWFMILIPVTSKGIDWHWSGISVLQRKTDPPRVTPGCSVCAVGAPTNNLHENKWINI